jgi:copper(I)-binding protein
MTRFSLTAAAAFLLTATTASAHDYKIGDLLITHPMAYETAPTARTAGGFMTITNTGDTADRLVAVEADFPRVELHTTEMDGDIARMVHQEDGIALPAGETIVLQPGGFHVMIMGLNGDPFEVGEEVPATLVFENAGRLEIVFGVEARQGSGMMNHGDMDHGDN